MKYFIFFILAIFTLCSCKQSDDPGRNSNIPTVKIGEKYWMTKNLDVDKYQNGDSIPQVSNPQEWAKLTTGAWCYYNNDPKLGAEYGKLYNWYAIIDKRGLAPAGFVVASYEDYQNLLKDFLTWEKLYLALKEAGYKHWQYYDPSTEGKDIIGFCLLPGGYRHYIDNTWNGLQTFCYLWTSTNQNSLYATYLFLDYAHITINVKSGNKAHGFSVRCIKK